MANVAPEGVPVQQNQNEQASARMKIAEPNNLVKILSFLGAVFMGIATIKTGTKPQKLQLAMLMFYTNTFGLLYLAYVSLPQRVQRTRTFIKILLNANAIAIFYSLQGIFIWQMCIVGPVLAILYVSIVHHFLRDYIATLHN